MAQLPQRLRLDLADALARHRESRPDLLEGVVRALADAEAEAQDLLLARRERREDLPGLVLEVQAHDRLRRRDRRLVLDEVTEDRIVVLADRRFERDRLLRDLHDAPDLLRGKVHPLRDLLGGRLPADLLHEVARGPDELV